ncbi:MAG: hypothetical protein M1827_006743 [Pycnora praestabilis]|nr:MAG: hypothetical protein M1827_006743 [Pycnora praestabilis]
MAYHVLSKPGHQLCDSYFVESHDDGVFAAQAERREQQKYIARERQLAIAEELSNVAMDQLLEDHLEHMEHMEAVTIPDVASIDIQTEIQWFMRPYLLDFLIEAHSSFQLLPETLYLAVNLLDRYCSKRVVYKRHYQLVACCALLIAAKYGDRKEHVPTIRELKGMCCSLYDDDMFIQMEWHVLATLDWAIGHPTVDSFLQLALSEAAYDPEVEHMAWFICEIAMFHRDFVATPSSVMARASLALSRCILNRSQPRHSEWAANYDSVTLVSLSQQLHRPSQILLRKYASPHFSAVSITLEGFLARQASIARGYVTPTTPYKIPSIVEPSTSINGGLLPQTPPKGQYPMAMNHGYVTPPITPEGETFDAANYIKPYAMHPPPQCPPTPSPTNTSAYAQQYDYYHYQPPSLVQ